jgi:hypothetical protein
MKSLLQRWLNPSRAILSIMCAYSHSFLFRHSHVARLRVGPTVSFDHHHFGYPPSLEE